MPDSFVTNGYMDDESNVNCLPEVRRDICLDKSRFVNVVPMLVVGLVCDSKFSRVCREIKSCFHTFIRVPRLTQTYQDSSGVLRKLLLLLHPSSFDDDNPSVVLLKSHNIEISSNPCPLDESIVPVDMFHSTQTVDTPVPTLVPDTLCAIKGPGRIYLKVGYENYSFEAALKALLPSHVSPISGFTFVGHVAHYNLRPDALPFRRLIGQVALDKFTNVRTVIHKAANIDSTYRTFQIDLMAGEADYITSVRENGLTFHLDISKVYWNSRLGTEHSRMIGKLLLPMSSDSQTVPAERVVVYDVFAGVGPFAIPAARLGCQVYANDLNPDSYQWLERNISENRSRKRHLENIHIYNMDGREFIRQVLLPHYWDTLTKHGDTHRFVTIMNLPAVAPEFMDAFVDDLHTQDNCSMSTVPIDFHCYCFLRKNVENEDTIKARIDKALKRLAITEDKDYCLRPVPKLQSWNLRFVRDVAPYKDMYCAEFQLWLAAPPHVAGNTCTDGIMHTKKQKLDDDL